MSVEKMKLLSITGREENIDQFISEYLLDSGLQTENAVKVFEKGWNLTNFKYDSSAKELAKSCKEVLDKYKVKYKEGKEYEQIEHPFEELEKGCIEIEENIKDFEQYIADKKVEREELLKREKLIEKTKNLDMDISKLENLEYIRFRLGKVLKENYNKLDYSLREINALLLKVNEKDTKDTDEEWVICICAKDNSAKVDSYLNLFKFERATLPSDMQGNTNELWNKYESMIQELNFDIENKENELSRIVNRDLPDLIEIYYELNLYIKINNVKKFMAYDENGLFYIIGWIPAKELSQVLPKLSKEKSIKYTVKNHDEVVSVPPTKLKNNKFIKPFETLVKMYGLPNYTETDPTLLVALTAFFLFGFMFGDVGHGLVIFLIGVILSIKKNDMGPIFKAGGVSSMIFGVLYGSVFGNEELIPSLFIRPMQSIKTMLILGIATGVFFIIITMVMNIQNGIRNNDKKKVFFDTNGIAGLCFYLLVLLFGIYFLLKGKMIVSVGVLSIFLLIPLLLIAFKDDIAKLIFKEEPEEKSTLAEKLFGIVEVLLSFASNTISFVRVAAFAINHVGLCMAVTILSQMANGAGSTIILIIGNAIVIVLEGLVVAIQVLRLEYYELFSRFYSGDGKEYKPLREKI